MNGKQTLSNSIFFLRKMVNVIAIHKNDISREEYNVRNCVVLASRFKAIAK